MYSAKKCKPAGLAKWLGSRGHIVLFDIVFGIQSGIPLCCVMEFVARFYLGDTPVAVATGCFGRKKHCGYVHCGIHRLFAHGGDNPVERDYAGFGRSGNHVEAYRRNIMKSTA